MNTTTAVLRPAPRRPRLRRLAGLSWFGLLTWLCLAAVLAFLTLPVIAVFVNTTPGRLLASLGSRASLEALQLSLETSFAALAAVILLGTPAAYLLATRRFRGQGVVLTLLELPLVLPPAVAGIGLLAALGPKGLLGGVLADAHVQLVFQTAGVIVALAFVSSPLYLTQAYRGFRAIERSHLEAALALGATRAGVFFRVALPIARPALFGGAALTSARALGEFGATLMFAGSFQGITQTLPLAIYSRFDTDFTGALSLSAVLVIVSASLLVTVKLLAGRQPPM